MASQAGRATPQRERLSGRHRELTLLEQALDDARAGRGRLVLLSGEPGIGKTRLAAAICDRAAALDLPVFWGRTAETSGAPPYWPWTQILRRGLALRGRDDVLASLPGGAAEISRLLPELSMESPSSAGSLGSDAAASARFRLCEEATAVLRHGAGADGAVVVLDDLHWADPPSLDLLSHIAADIEDSRMLIIGTTRDAPDDVTPALRRTLARLARQDAVLRIPLTGLDDCAVREHLVAVFGREVPEAMARQVCDRADGNPFFVGELARLLRSGAGSLPDAGGAALPPGVRDVLALRLEPLPAPTRELLDIAGLMGRDPELDVLACASGLSTDQVLAAVDPAIQRGILVQGHTAGRLRFTHALVAETLRALLPGSRSARLHQRIAEAIESTRCACLDDWLATLAIHWSGAAQTPATSRRTVEVARRAAEQAEGRLADADAVPLWRLALDAAVRAGAGDAPRAELLLALAGSLFRSGDIAGSFAGCRDAAAAAAAAGRDDLIVAAALVVEGTGEQGWANAQIALARQALASVMDGSRAEQVSSRARLHAQIAHALQFTEAPDRLEQARAESAAAVALAERCGDPRALVAALRSRQLVVSGAEGVDERLDLGRRMIEISEQESNLVAALWGRLWRADALFQHGDLDGVEAELCELASVVEQLRWPVARWHLLRSRAALLLARGRHREADAAAHEAHDALFTAGLMGAEEAVLRTLECLADMVGSAPGDRDQLTRRRDLTERDAAGGRGPRVTYILNLVREGEVEKARAQYALLPPVDDWVLNEFLRMAFLFYRLRAATALGLNSELEALLPRVLPLAHWHIVGGAGMVSSGGPGFLHVGAAEAALGRFDQAVEHVERALQDSRRWGLLGWAAVAEVQLAEILVRRATGSDLERARRLATLALGEARQLGMRPAAARAEQLLSELPRIIRSVEELTPRELQVAALVAQGLTNRQLAVRLGITERTAETHVDHILSKLKFRSRAQVGAWMADRANR